jgi:DNA-binding CsgD family transcriptional regulator
MVSGGGLTTSSCAPAAFVGHDSRPPRVILGAYTDDSDIPLRQRHRDFDALMGASCHRNHGHKFAVRARSGKSRDSRGAERVPCLRDCGGGDRLKQPGAVTWDLGIHPAVRVAVIDENDIFRRGLVACMEVDPALDVVFEGPSGPVTGRADAAVVSETSARRESVHCPLIVCTNDPGSFERRPGSNRIVAVLPREALTEKQLVAAVRAAAAGLCVDLDATGHGLEERSLPQRSTEILRLLAEGAGTREISVSVGYSERTVKSVIQEIQRELGARSRAQVVAQAIRRGFILVSTLAITLPPCTH